jgi:hypothetical protein
VKFNVLILLKETFFFFDGGIRTEKETTLLHEVLNILSAYCATQYSHSWQQMQINFALLCKLVIFTMLTVGISHKVLIEQLYPHLNHDL